MIVRAFVKTGAIDKQRKESPRISRCPSFLLFQKGLELGLVLRCERAALPWISIKIESIIRAETDNMHKNTSAGKRTRCNTKKPR